MPRLPPWSRLRAHRATRIAPWVLIAGALAYLLYLAATGTNAVPKRVMADVPTVHLEHVEPPPPPPPPPPKPKFEAQPKDRTTFTPNPQPDQRPPTPGPPSPPGPPALATNAAGPPDAFGLAGNPNGGDFIGGGGGGGGGSAFGWYAAMLEARVSKALSSDPRLRGVRYRVLVQIWLTGEGAVQRTAYVATTGERDVDRTIQTVLAGLARLPEPPKDLPQPIVLRLSGS